MAESNYNMDQIPTFVALPVDAFENNALQKPEQFQIIKNALIKTLSDGSLCVIDIQNNPIQQQVQLSYIPLNSVQQQNEVILDKPTQLVLSKDTKEETITPKEKPTSSLFKCPKCKEVFAKITLYRKHMTWHRNSKKYKCDKCSAGYNVETNLKIHMAMHLEGKPTCPICSITFQRLASLKSHLMLHQVEELYTCEECGAEFEKEEELNKHHQNHLNNITKGDNSLICSYCNVQFEDHKSYKEHISHHIKVKKMVLSGKKSRKTHGNKAYPHVCSVCFKSFSRLSLLERHLRVHSGERPFVCEHCNRGFNQKGTLQIHLSKHTGVKPFQCTLCSAKFNQKGNLRVHVEKTHTAPMPGVKMFKCSHCTCIFKKVASLNVHITKFHANNEDLENITNVMNRLKELKEKTGVALEDKIEDQRILEENREVLDVINYYEDVSNTSFVRLAESFLDGSVRRYLVMQKKMNDMRIYICCYCNKEFKKPSDLIRHTRVHTREKPFACNKCGAKFSLKSTLFCHVKTHMSHNNFFCAICMKKFSSMRSVNLHLRKHEQNNSQYKCFTCNKWFASLQKAKLHNREVHENQNDKDPLHIMMKQPLFSTPNGLLPVEPTKSLSERTNIKPFSCSVCNSKFSKMPTLKRHMLLHSGERKYKCDQCLKSYFSPHGLKDHLRCHSGDWKHACKVCGKKFMTASLLKRHEVSHNTQKPYICPYCEKNFKSLMLCKKHMNVHKKDVTLQTQALDGSGELLLSESENAKLVEFSNSTSSTNNCILLGQPNTLNIPEVVDSNNRELISQPNINQITHASGNSIQNTIGQQLYEVTPNSIQVITNSDKNIPQNTSNQIQTIFINCDDLQLIDNNLDNIYTQTPSTDTLLFNSLSNLPDTNTFSIQPFSGEFSSQNPEVFNQTYNVTQIINNESTNTDLTNKVLKLNIGSTKSKIERTNTISDNVNINDNILPTYYSQSELNLLLNLGPEFETNNCDLPNHNLNLLNEVPDIGVNSFQENVETNEQKTKKPFLTCDQCNIGFGNKKAFKKHLSTHKARKQVKVNSHQCPFCGKIFKKQSDLARHIRTHTGEKPFACDKCEKKFTLKSTLLSHQRTHNPVSHKQFSCVVCNSFFTSKCSLKVHMSVHTGEKTFKCQFCFAKFRTAAHRKSHESGYHLNASKKTTKNKVTNLLASVAMDVLDQQDQSSLQNDQIISDGDLQNVLIVQEQLPIAGDQLNLLSETSQNPIESNQLVDPMILQQPNFLLNDSLIQSSFIQLDDGTLLNVKAVDDQQEVDNVALSVVEKPRNFECDICHKKYASKDVLRKHKKIHGINKTYRCVKCEKGFDTEDDLQRHEKTHDGYRPYSCFYCANSFLKEHSLATHMKRIHNMSYKDNILLCDLK